MDLFNYLKIEVSKSVYRHKNLEHILPFDFTNTVTFLTNNFRIKSKIRNKKTSIRMNMLPAANVKNRNFISVYKGEVNATTHSIFSQNFIKKKKS